MQILQKKKKPFDLSQKAKSYSPQIFIFFKNFFQNFKLLLLNILELLLKWLKEKFYIIVLSYNIIYIFFQYSISIRKFPKIQNFFQKILYKKFTKNLFNSLRNANASSSSHCNGTLFKSFII